MAGSQQGRVFLLIAMTLLFNNHVQGLIAGLITGFVIGSLWVGKGQDEMMRQLVQALRIATGGVK